MRSVFEGGEGVTRGGRSDKSRESDVLRPFDVLEDRDTAGDDDSEAMVCDLRRDRISGFLSLWAQRASSGERVAWGTAGGFIKRRCLRIAA